MLSANFHLKDLGEANVFLWIKITRFIKEISLDQSHYIEKVMFASIIGTLEYVDDCTRRDIAYVIGWLCRFISKPSIEQECCRKSYEILRKNLEPRITLPKVFRCPRRL